MTAFSKTISILYVLAAIGTAGAQTPAKQSILGEVTAIDTAKPQITLKQDNTGKVFTVNPAAGASYIRIAPGETDIKKGQRIQITDISTGDRLMARGSAAADGTTFDAAMVIAISKSDLAQKQAKEQAEWQTRGFGGAVTAKDPAQKQITVTIRGMGQAKPIVVTVDDKTKFHRYAQDSLKFSDAKASSFDEVQIGDQAKVLGEKPAENGAAKAEAIVFGTFQNLAGTVDSVDPAANQIRLTTLDKKKVLIKVGPDTQGHTLPQRLAQMLAFSLQGGGAGMQSGRGGPGGGGPGGGGPGGGGPGGGAPGGPGRGPGGPGGAMGARDFQQALQNMPKLDVKELKKGDALIILTTALDSANSAKAITILAGVEPLLTEPRAAQQVLGGWNLEMNIPMQ